MIHLSSLQIFIIYWIYTIIVETIYYYNLIKSEIKKLKAVPEYDLYFKAVIEQIKQVAYMRLSFKRMFNPFTYILMYLVFCIFCPILFPYNIFNRIKRIFGYKSELEKRAEEAAKEYYAAQEKNDNL